MKIRLTRLIVLLTLGLGPARSALADPAVDVDHLGVRLGYVTVAFRLVAAFDEERRASLAQGLPITVRFTVDLWRDRRNWFDKQIESRVRSYRLRYHPGERIYSLTATSHGSRRQTFDTLDELIEEISYREFIVYPRWRLTERHDYFVLAEVAIQPLTLKEFKELDGWISGRIRGGASPDDETIDEEDEEGRGISAAFFEFLVDLSGFGDVIFDTRTPLFRPSDLPLLDEFPEVPADDLD